MVSGAEAEAGQCWLQHAKLCRVSGHFEAATTASLEALARQVPGAGLEHAKLMWDMDKPHRAIISLQEVLLHACATAHRPTSAFVACVFATLQWNAVWHVPVQLFSQMLLGSTNSLCARMLLVHAFSCWL